jgi:hypothetical protein
MSDDELLNRYGLPKLVDEGDDTVEQNRAEVAKAAAATGFFVEEVHTAESWKSHLYTSVPTDWYLVLMLVGKQWVVAAQGHDEGEVETAMLDLDEAGDGHFELRCVKVTTLELVAEQKEEDDGA